MDNFIITGDKPWETIVNLGAWDRGERYMKDIIEVSLILVYSINNRSFLYVIVN